MASKDDPYDYSNLKKSDIVDNFLVDSTNCVSVATMLQKLSGTHSQYIFMNDSVMATYIYAQGKEDLCSLAMKHDIFFLDNVKSITSEAVIAVVNYKKVKLRRPRLTTVACLKIQPFLYMGTTMDDLTFLRLYNIPCKSPLPNFCFLIVIITFGCVRCECTQCGQFNRMWP